MRYPANRELSSGLKLLCIFYLTNAVLFLATALLFIDYVDLIILGNTVCGLNAVMARLAFMLFPLYLAYGIYFLKRTAYFPAMLYHLVFIVNAVLTILSILKVHPLIRPAFEIVLKPEYKAERLQDLFKTHTQVYLVQAFSIIVGIFIILYISSKREDLSN